MRKWFLSLIIVGVAVLLCFWFLPVTYKNHSVQKPFLPDTSSSKQVSLKAILIHKLEKMVQDGSDGLYHLSVEDLDITLVPSKVVFKNIVLTPDSIVMKQAGDSYARLFKVSLPYLSIGGIDLSDLLNRKNIRLDSIHIRHPIIEVFQYKSYKKATTDSATLYQRISNELKSLAVKQIFIEGAHIISHSEVSKNKEIQFKDVSLWFKDLLMDSSTQYDRKRFLFAKEAHITLKDFEAKTNDQLYYFRIGKVDVDAVKKNMLASSVSLVPLYSKQQFQKHISAMKEWYDMVIPQVEFKNIDWWSLTNRESIIADEATFKNEKVSIYLDRSLPKGKAEIHNYPHQILMKLPYQVRLSRLYFKNADVVYQEFNPLSGEAGTIHFANINGKLLGVTNIPSEIKKGKQATAYFTADFMGTSAQVSFTFDLIHSQKGNFSASILSGKLDITKLNSLTEPFALLKAKSGTIQKMSAAIQGDNYSGNGNVLLLYDDYKMILLKKDKDAKNDFKKKTITGFLANAFVIKNDNPLKGELPRNPSCSFKRDPHSSFFSLIWKTMLVGILKTIGANPKLAYEK